MTLAEKIAWHTLALYARSPAFRTLLYQSPKLRRLIVELKRKMENDE